MIIKLRLSDYIVVEGDIVVSRHWPARVDSINVYFDSELEGFPWSFDLLDITRSIPSKDMREIEERLLKKFSMTVFDFEDGPDPCDVDKFFRE